MRKREVIVCLVIVVLFFVLANSFEFTGYSVIQSGVDVNEEVLQEVSEKGEVDVIVKMKKDTEIFFVKQKIESEDILDKLDEDEFEKQHELEQGFSGKTTLSGLNKLKTDLNVERIELNHEMGIFLQDSINVINASNLHDLGVIGSGKSVCIIDTGIAYDHPDLNEKYLGGFDFFNNDSDPYDDHGHGTHVSGIVVANGGTVGIAKGANIVVTKVVDANGVGSEADIIKGIEYCTAHKDEFNITAISLSLGTSSTFENYCDANFISLSEAVNNAVANGIIVIAASGNSGSTTGISSPACLQNTVAVGATTKSDGIASYSNRNSITDLFAPGSYITSLWLTGTKTLSGTSMSAPHAAAAVALLRSNKGLTNEEVINALKEGKLIEGIPRIDLYKAYLSLDTEAPVITIIEPENNITLNYTNILFNITSDEKIFDVVIEIGGENETMLGSENNYHKSKTLRYGNYNYKFYGHDLSNNLGVSEERSLFVDVLGENITYSPEGTNININELENQTFSIVGENLTIIWYVDNVNVSTEESYVFISNYDGAGEYNVTVYANSDFNYWNLIVNNVNREPFLNESIPDQEWNENTNLELDLSPYFLDPDENELSYSSNDVENINISINGNLITLIPDGNFSGSRVVILYANDGEFSIESNNVSLTVKNLISCGDSIIEGSEECDSGELNGNTCINFDYSFGNLSCIDCMFNFDECTNEESPAEEPPAEEDSGDSGGGGSGGGTPLEEEFIEEETFIEPSAPSEALEELLEITETEEIVEEVQEEPEQKKMTGMTAKGFEIKSSWMILAIATLVVVVGIIVFKKFFKTR